MNRVFLVGAALALASMQAVAEQKLSLKDVTAGAFRSEYMDEVCPLGDGETYAQISSDGQQIVAYSFRTGKKVSTLFDAATARGARVGRVDGYSVSPDGKRLLIQTQTRPIYRRSFTANYYIYSIQNNKLEPLSEGGPQQTPVWSPDGNVIAFARDNNIFLVKLLYDNAESQVTKDGKPGEVINGTPDWVYEEEFSTNSSMVFTADSKQVVWIRYDESQVRQYDMQLFKGLAPEREDYRDYPGLYTYKYPVPGEANSKVCVMSFDIKSRQTRRMNLPLDDDGYIPRLKATSDPTKVAVFTMNRHQDVLRIYMANPLSTVCQLVVEDRVDKYVKEETLEQTLVTDKHILLASERNGYNQLFLYNLNGQLVRTVAAPKAQDSRLGELATMVRGDGRHLLCSPACGACRPEGLRVEEVGQDGVPDRAGRLELGHLLDGLQVFCQHVVGFGQPACLHAEQQCRQAAGHAD